jgi:hypothetical protein
MIFIDHARFLITDALHDRTFKNEDAIVQATRPVETMLRKRKGESEFATVFCTFFDGELLVVADEAGKAEGFTSEAQVRLRFKAWHVTGGIRLSLLSSDSV